MKRKSIIRGVVGAISAVGVAVFGWHKLTDGMDMCQYTPLQKASSPDGRLKAVVFDCSCGVFTTGTSTQVAVMKQEEALPTEHGIVFVAH